MPGQFNTNLVPDFSYKLEDIDATIQGAVTSTSADGHSATQDLSHLERIQRDIRLRDTQHIKAGRVRPSKVRMLLGGSW